MDSFREKLLNRLYFIYIKGHYFFYRNRFSEKIEHIMRFDRRSRGIKPDTCEEQGMPGFHKTCANGWHRYMLGRYFFSLRSIKNKTVLDSGCGLGWGSYLICELPRELISIDINEKALSFARGTWDDSKLNFRKLSILEIDLLRRKFDVILSYEIIEHLAWKEGLRYLSQISGNLVSGGKLIMSSYFPSSAGDAEKEEAKNPYHLHIYTKREMREELAKRGFTKVKFLGSLMLSAEKE
ncbi:MAG: class I SAM-dependent methyltransferase [Candidatus Krumholzibacteriota bacterium]|nr:class I SAM-dependent methyltransferase [Candidatus Krumholzibacteriota bacterium]